MIIRPGFRRDAESENGFLADSILRRVCGQRVVWLWGLQRAAALQGTHPRAWAIFARHTGPEEEVFRRFADTARALGTVIFDTQTSAEEVGRRVRALHARMAGDFGDDAPIDLRGPYRADEPELLQFVLALLGDSWLDIFTSLGGELSPGELNRYVDELLQVGELFGLTDRPAWSTYREFREYVQGELTADRRWDSQLREDARRLGRRLVLDMPVKPRHVPLRAVARVVVIGRLPAPAREFYDFPWDARHERSFELLVVALRALRKVTPSAVWSGSPEPAYASVTVAEARINRRIERIARLVPSTLGGHTGRSTHEAQPIASAPADPGAVLEIAREAISSERFWAIHIICLAGDGPSWLSDALAVMMPKFALAVATEAVEGPAVGSNRILHGVMNDVSVGSSLHLGYDSLAPVGLLLTVEHRQGGSFTLRLFNEGRGSSVQFRAEASPGLRTWQITVQDDATPENPTD